MLEAVRDRRFPSEWLLSERNVERANNMTSGKPAKKPKTSAPGVKMLITATSLAATLGGWALISSTAAQPAPAPDPAPEQTSNTTVTIKFAPLPTLVPPLTPQPQMVTIDQPRPAAPAASAPQPAPANTIVLRDVSAPALPSRSAPASVTNTRSSR